MTITLSLGVWDVPYATQVPSQQRRVFARTAKGGTTRRGSAAPSGGETTGDVAERLEDKYHVMEVFVEEIGNDKIVKALERSIEGAMTDLVLGKNPNIIDPFASVVGEIETAFRLFLSQEEMNGIVPGVPTKAAIAGVNHRLARPYAKGNPSRPSFIDTGTYQSHFRAVIKT